MPLSSITHTLYDLNHAVAVGVADLDGDGRLDLAVASQGAPTGGLNVTLGPGGIFDVPKAEAMPSAWRDGP